MNAITIIAEAYRSYVVGYDVDGTSSGACLAITRDLDAAGLITDNVTGEASVEARIERVLAEHVIDHDGWVNENDFAEAVAIHLGLIEAVA